MNQQELDMKALVVAKNNMGEFAWPTVLLAVVVAVGYFGTMLAAASQLLPLWLAVALTALFTYAAYTVLHESVHGLIHGRYRSWYWLNNTLGYLAAFITMIPFTAHKHEHLVHHRNTNDTDKDPDFKVSEMSGSFWNAIKTSKALVFNQYRFYLDNCWDRACRADRARFVLEIAASLMVRIAFVMQGLWLEGFMLFIVGSGLGVITVVYLFAYIVHRPHSVTGRYVDTSTITAPGYMGKIITGLWLFQNYHSVHHLFPRVPFYKYTEVFNGIEEVMLLRGAPIYQLTPTGLKRF
jgi:beta-carotene hydroxylase